ncbi:hypothetical protein D9M68_760130 [compost metagenome]
MAGKTHEEEVTSDQRLGGLAQGRQQVGPGGLFGDQQCAFHALGLRDGRHVVRIEFTGGQWSGPALVVGRADFVEADVQRHGLGLLRCWDRRILAGHLSSPGGCFKLFGLCNLSQILGVLSL